MFRAISSKTAIIDDYLKFNTKIRANTYVESTFVRGIAWSKSCMKWLLPCWKYEHQFEYIMRAKTSILTLALAKDPTCGPETNSEEDKHTASCFATWSQPILGLIIWNLLNWEIPHNWSRVETIFLFWWELEWSIIISSIVGICKVSKSPKFA